MFTMSKVSSVYSGRNGCACGCRGNYAYASTHKDARPSYLTGDDGVNDRTVKLITNKVDKFLRDGSAAAVMVDDDFIAIDMANDRTYTVYFR